MERTPAWLCKCRGIVVRHDKKDQNDLGSVQLACALFWYRRLDRLGCGNAPPAQHNRS